jgi:GT2 family glycosyltransferase
VGWKQLFETVGLFNQNMKSGGDLEWGKRAFQLGSRARYSPNAIVKHPSRTSFAQLLNKERRVVGGMRDYWRIQSKFSFIQNGLRPFWESVLELTRIPAYLTKVWQSYPRKSPIQLSGLVLISQAVKAFEWIVLGMGGKSRRL